MRPTSRMMHEWRPLSVCQCYSSTNKPAPIGSTARLRDTRGDDVDQVIATASTTCIMPDSS